MYKTIIEKLFIHNLTERVYSRIIALLLMNVLAILINPTTIKAESFSNIGQGLLIQQALVTGKVVDTSGEPLIGITVGSPESTQTTTTNLDGDFRLEVNKSKVTISFSGVGYKTQQLAVTVGSPIEVTLIEEVSSLDEVVVVGYGTVRRGDLTGSVASVKSEDIVRSPSSNAMEAIQGQVPGLDIVRNSGSATSGTTINIRGKRSLSSATDVNGNSIANAPLFIIDGVQGGNYEDINPQDIESIEVMKDASSTAIYGSQGANGVIIITTKKGKSGEARIAYNGYTGVNGWAQYPEMRTGEDYVTLRQEAAKTAGQWSSSADDQTLFTPEEWTALQENQWVNWVDEVVKTGVIQSHQVSVSGGTENTTGLLSAGYYQEKGAFKDDELDKYNIRLNLDHTLGKAFKIGATSQVTHYLAYTRADNILWRASTNVPLGRAYDEFGNVNLWPLGLSGKVSPLADEADEFVAKHQTMRTNVIANGYLEIKPIEGLSFRSNLGTNLNYRKNSDFESPNSIDRAGQYDVSLASILSSQRSFLSWDNIANYSKTFNDHSLAFTALTSWTQSKYTSSYNEGTGQLIPSQLWHNLAANDKASYVIASNYIQSQTFSYALRANYNFKGKYLLTASNRWDGASRLAKGNKWASFPSVALAWRVNDEEWFRTSEAINDFKIRLSWGVTGNSGISEYGTQSGLRSNTNSAFQDQAYTYYVYNTLIGNENLSWEKSASWNLGFDLGLLNNKVNATIDLYNTKTTDILLPRTLPTSMGSGNNTPFQIYENIGSTNNKGIELSINTKNITREQFNWNSTVTFAANKEEITQLIDGRDIIGATTRETQSLLIGRPLNSFYTFKRLGVWQLDEADEAASYFKDAAKTQPFKPGDIKLADLDGDNVIDEVNDVQYIGSTSPKWTLGFHNSINYKSFDLGLYFIARWGQMIQYDFTSAYDPSGQGNQAAYLDYWTPENPSNDFPRPDLTNFYNYRGYQALSYVDGSYLKFKTASLGYTLPKNTFQNLKVSNLRVYLSANNLFTVANSHLIKNYDPERGGSAKSPLQRQFVFGINLDF